jgi:ATP-dependent protease ClpP protease subunit
MFEIKNEAGRQRAEIYLYDRIGVNWWGEGVSAKEFSQALDDLSPKPVDIHIHSGGGDVFEGYAMCTAVQRYEGETVAYIDGLAASAASYIAVVCDRVVMADYAQMMIHKASADTYGNADYLERMAARLRETDKTISGFYLRRTSLDAEQVEAYMAEEHWFNAQDAMACGMCQEVVQTEERIAACIPYDIAKRYRNIPGNIAVSKRDDDEAGVPGFAPASVEAENQGASYTVSNITESSQEAKSAEQEGPAYVLLNGRVYERNANAEL